MGRGRRARRLLYLCNILYIYCDKSGIRICCMPIGDKPHVHTLTSADIAEANLQLALPNVNSKIMHL